MAQLAPESVAQLGTVYPATTHAAKTDSQTYIKGVELNIIEMILITNRKPSSIILGG